MDYSNSDLPAKRPTRTTMGHLKFHGYIVIKNETPEELNKQIDEILKYKTDSDSLFNSKTIENGKP